MKKYLVCIISTLCLVGFVLFGTNHDTDVFAKTSLYEMKVNVSSVKILSKPSKSSSVRSTLKKGNRVNVVLDNEGHGYIQVLYKGKTGYIINYDNKTGKDTLVSVPTKAGWVGWYSAGIGTAYFNNELTVFKKTSNNVYLTAEATINKKVKKPVILKAKLSNAHTATYKKGSCKVTFKQSGNHIHVSKSGACYKDYFKSSYDKLN